MALSSSSLPSLTSWSMQHINEIFEASSDEESLRAVDTTFSRTIEASVNGKSIQYRDIQGMVLALRANSNLTVLWQRAQELPDDATTNQSGKFNGTYIIRGIQRTLPGSNGLVEFERHKTVEVEIKPVAKGVSYDSRRVVRLAFVATDVRINIEIFTPPNMKHKTRVDSYHSFIWTEIRVELEATLKEQAARGGRRKEEHPPFRIWDPQTEIK